MNDRYTLEEWLGMLEEAGMDEGRLSKLAAGLGLGAAALMGSPEKAQAQQAPTTQVPNDSVQTGTSRDLGMAQRRAELELDKRRIDRQGVRQSVKQNPDGTWSVTIDARKQPTQSGAPRMEERYSLEEWLGMLEEAGYDTSEVYSLWRPKEHGAKSTGVIKTTKKEEPKEKPVKKKMEEGNKEHEVKKESINENTVSRLQSLAGIKPTK